MKTQSKEQKQKVIKHCFTIIGNPDSPEGNPIPKLRMTRAQSWRPEAQRYAAWKHHVVGTLIDSVRGTDLEALVIRNIGIYGKPFSTKKDLKMKMEIMIRWSSGTHGDPENIFGSIADALFKQDKWLAVGADFYDEEGERGEVEVIISFIENQK